MEQVSIFPNEDSASAAVAADNDAAVDELAYRFWSIRPKELDCLRASMPDGYRGGVRAWFFACEMRKLLAASTERAGKLERERDDADRRAGAAERHLEDTKDTIHRTRRWRDEWKERLGYGHNVSFDVVWKDTLAKAQSVPELQLRIESLKSALEWFLENDDTNEGDVPMPEHGGRTWNELNAFWIDGLDRARAALNGLESNLKLEPAILEAAANIVERMPSFNGETVARRMREAALEIHARSTIQEKNHVG